MLKKILRDCRTNAMSLSAIAVLVFLTLFVFSGLLSAAHGMSYEFERWSMQTNLADAWVSVRSAGATLTDEVNNAKHVSHADGSLIVTASMKRSGANKLLTVNLKDSNEVSRPLVNDGEQFDTKKKNSIWIDKNFADANHISTGDTVTINVNKSPIALTVRGLIASPEYIGYTSPMNDMVANHDRYGYAYTNRASLPVTLDRINSIAVKAEPGCDTGCIARSVRDTLGNAAVSVQGRDAKTEISKFQAKTASMYRMSYMFSTLMIVLVTLTTITTISRLVNSQRSSLGLMRALGISRSALIFGYQIYAIIATLPSALLGLFLGPALLGRLFLDKQRFLFNLPHWQVRIDNASWLMILGIIIASSIASIIPAFRITRLTPAMILDTNTMRGVGTMRSTPRNPRRDSQQHWQWHWIMRDKSRSMVKEGISVVAIIGATVLVMASFGVRLSLTATNDMTYGDVFRYGRQIQLANGYTDTDYDTIMSGLPDNAQSLEQLPITVTTAHHEQSSVMSIATPGIFLTARDDKRESMPITTQTDGAYISERLSKALGVTSGDTISVDSASMSEPVIMTVIDIVRVSSPQGIYLSSAYWKNLGETFHPTSIMVNGRVPSSVDNHPAVQRVDSLAWDKAQANKVLDTFQSILTLLMVFAVLLEWFILYSIGTLNYTERYREYATMRVLGFHIKEIRSIMLKDSFVTWILGTTLGIPLGIGFLNAYVSVADSKDAQFFAYLPTPYIALSALFVLCNMLIIELVIAKRIANIDLSSALKSVE